MKLLLSALVSAILASCASFPLVSPRTQQPLPSATPDLIGTLVASGPMLDVSFDGTKCTMSGPLEVPIGALVLRFLNTGGNTATPWVARNYPGKSWQDVLEGIGEPGSEVPETWDWIALLGYDRSVSMSPTISYRQYNLKLAAEYHVAVEYPVDHLWPCGPFHVLPSQ